MNGKTMDNSVIKAMDTELGDQGFISGCGRTRFSTSHHLAGSVAHSDTH